MGLGQEYKHFSETILTGTANQSKELKAGGHFPVVIIRRGGGLLERFSDGSNRRDGKNNILNINVLRVTFPQLIEL